MFKLHWPWSRQKPIVHAITHEEANLGVLARLVDVVVGLSTITGISLSDALRTAAIRVGISMPYEASEFLMILSQVWAETDGYRIQISPDDVKVILTHSTSVQAATAALLELWKGRTV